MARKELITALDIGSSRICCFVAEIDETDRVSVTGIGHHASQGIKAGTIVNMEDAQHSVISAVYAAEQMAGEQIRDVFVNISCGHPESGQLVLETSIDGSAIGDSEMRRLLNENRLRDTGNDRALVHAIPAGYKIDGSNGIRDPRGLSGQTLGVQIRTVSVSASAIQNLNTCIGRCHLNVRGHVVSAYASGLSCLVEDETDLGVTVIDMGGGTTTMAVFFDGSVIYTDCVPVGGAHITSDIARGLATPVSEAERLKTLYGSAIPSSLDEREMIDVPLVGEQDENHPNHVPKSLLIRIIHPRLEETFELVRNRLEASGFDKVAGRRVVITGGASQMPGIRDLAQEILDKQVRLGRPIRVNGLADVASGPAFATSAGLLAYAADPALDASRQGHVANKETGGGLFGRVGSWLRENF